MVRERVVADAAARFFVLVDAPKMVASLDVWGVLPIAVVPFAAARVGAEMSELSPVQRNGRSDDGLALIDLTVPPGISWRDLADRVRTIPGVVDHGLFEVPLADVLVGAPDGTVTSG